MNYMSYSTATNTNGGMLLSSTWRPVDLTKKNICPQKATRFSTPTTVFSLTQRSIIVIAMIVTMGPDQNLQNNSIHW